MNVKIEAMKRVKNLLLLLLLPWLALAVVDLRAQETVPTVTPEGGQPEGEGPQTHIIEEGENLTTIAAEYEVSVSDLMLVNDLDEDSLIYPGQELVIPGGEGAVVATSWRVWPGSLRPRRPPSPESIIL